MDTNKVTRLVQSPLIVAGSNIAATTLLNRVSGTVRVYITIPKKKSPLSFLDFVTGSDGNKEKKCS